MLPAGFFTSKFFIVRGVRNDAKVSNNVRSVSYKDVQLPNYPCLFTIMATLVWAVETKDLGIIQIKSSGPKPFNKNLIILEDKPKKNNAEETYYNGENTDQNLLENLNPHDETKQLNLTTVSQPHSPINETSADILQPPDDNQSTEIPKRSSVVKKPSGTLYVDSVHNLRHPATPFRTEGIPGCSVDKEEDKDPHRLSASRFGFPKSIVNKALDDSPFKHVLAFLAKQQYYHSYKQQQQQQQYTDTEDKNEYRKPENSLDPFSGVPTAPDSRMFSYNDNNITPDSMTIGVKHDNVNSQRTDPQEEKRTTGQFYQQGGYQNDFVHDRNENHDPAVPHLLEGSVFKSILKPNHHQNDINNRNVVKSQNINTSKNSNNLSPFYSHTNHSLPNVIKSTVQDREKTSTFFDAVVSSNMKTPNGNAFSQFLPDVSGGQEWSTNVKDFNSFKDLDTQSYLPYKSNGNSGLPKLMKNLFPPKKSEKLPEISGLKDLIPSKNPVMKYSNDRKSNVDSPFDFDIKSIFGSIPGSSLGQNRDEGSKTSALPSSSTASGNFGFFAGGGKTPGRFNMPSISHGHNMHFSGKSLTRRKRQISDPSPTTSTTKDTCKPSYNILRQYQNHGGACFVVLPEVQGIQFATCPEGSCAGCMVNGGISKCRAARVPMWVWAYCEAGPNAGVVVADKILVSVACQCKVTYCQRVPLGRS